MEHYHLFLGLHGDDQVYHINTAIPGSYAGLLTAGPYRLIEFLELHTGLAAPPVPNQQRLLTLKKSLDQVYTEPQFSYKTSYENDPLGVSERLLNLWDTWLLSGWHIADDEDLPGRMQLLYRYRNIFLAAGTGLAGRIENIMRAIEEGLVKLPPMRLTLIDAREHFPFLFTRLLGVLAKQVTIENDECTPRAPATSDLGKLQRLINHSSNKTAPTPLDNDGSLQLLYFPDDIQAATAMYSIMQQTSWKPLVINRDNGFLNGLAIAHGKPVCDWHSTGGNGQVLQLFFLATAPFKRPLQSTQLQSFLSSPYLPFSRRLARDLLYAFCEKPGMNNPQWNKAIEDYLLTLKGKEGEKHKTKAVAFWLQHTSHLHENTYDVTLLKDIYTSLKNWAVAKLAFIDNTEVPLRQFRQLATICDDLLTCLQDEAITIAAARFERLQVRLFRQTSFAITDAQAGCYDTVNEPGNIWVPAPDILWMNATRENGSSALSKYWYNAEKEWFKNKGLPVADESSTYSAYLAGIKRMVLSATKRLVLVIPASYHGEESYEPYCIQEWNQLIDCKKISTHVNGLLQQTPWQPVNHLTTEYAAVVLPKPQTYISIPKKAFSRETESYTSLEKLLQHPLEWFFSYFLKLNHTAGLEVPGTDRLMGIVADSLVQRVFSDRNTQENWWTDETAFTRFVYKELDEVLETEGIPLLENVNKRLLLEFKKTLARNTGCLRRLVIDNGFHIEGTQVPAKGIIAGQSFYGPIDLVLKKGKQAFIIDLKWTRSVRSFQERLQTGRDLQLVIYRALLPTSIKAAYFLLNNGSLMLRAELPALELTGPVIMWVTTEDELTTLTILERVIKGFSFRLKEIANGKLESAYHDELGILQPDYFLQQSKKKLYPLAEVDGFKKPPYDNSLQLITGQVS